jgi:hypothetical protein
LYAVKISPFVERRSIHLDIKELEGKKELPRPTLSESLIIFYLDNTWIIKPEEFANICWGLLGVLEGYVSSDSLEGISEPHLALQSSIASILADLILSDILGKEEIAVQLSLAATAIELRDYNQTMSNEIFDTLFDTSHEKEDTKLWS